MAAEDGVALVTGGAGGIGLAVCRALARDGRRVVVVDIDAGRAGEAARQLRDEGLAASHAACDVGSSAAVAALREGLLAEGSSVAVLANLAGIFRNAVLSRVTDEDFAATMNSHVGGTLNTMRAFAPDMKKRRYGRIVNMSSIAALGSLAGASYSAAKGAIEALSRTVAIEMAPHGVTVNCVSPGVIDTGMFLHTPADFQEKMLSRTPMKRVGLPDEVAACVEFFASPRASFVTGQTLFVCGGITLGPLS